MASIVEKAAFVKNDGKYIHPETCASVVYYDEEHTVTVKEKIDEILEEMEGMTYVPISINNGTKVDPSELETGQIITSITFTLKFSKVPTKVSIEGGNIIYSSNSENNPIPLAMDTIYTIPNLFLKDSVKFILKANDAKGNEVKKDINISKKFKIFYGTGGETLTNLTDLNSYLANTKEKELEVNGNGKYIYFCYPLANINDTASFYTGIGYGAFSDIGYMELTKKYIPSSNSFEYTSNIINNVTDQTISQAAKYFVENEDGSYITKHIYIIYRSNKIINSLFKFNVLNKK